MNSPAPEKSPTIPTGNLTDQLLRIGLRALPAQLDDFLARATKARWSPLQTLEQLTRAENDERSRRSPERRLRLSGLKSFKPMTDFDWAWPVSIDRDVVERALTLDFMPEARNIVLIGRNGLGKTMIAQTICHTAVQAGYSVLFRSAAALIEDLPQCHLHRDHAGPAAAPRRCHRSGRQQLQGSRKRTGNGGAESEKMSDPSVYIAAVLVRYAELPDTPLHAGTSDRWTARRLFEDHIPLSVVEAALSPRLAAASRAPSRNAATAAYPVPCLLPSRYRRASGKTVAR